MLSMCGDWRMMAVMALGLSTVRCGSGEPRPGAPPPPSAAVVVPLSQEQTSAMPRALAAQPEPKRSAMAGDGSALRSVPRADWPCRIDFHHHEDNKSRIFHYDGGPKQCWIPMELHLEGMVGCPTRVVLDVPSLGLRRKHDVLYDKQDRLIETGGGALTVRYTWKGRSVRSDGHSRYEVTGNVVNKRSHENDKIDHAGYIKKGLLMRYEYRNSDRVTGTATLDWSGTRLKSIDIIFDLNSDRRTSYVAVYSCDEPLAAKPSGAAP